MMRVTIAVSLVLVICRGAEAQPASPRIGLVGPQRSKQIRIA